MNKKFFVVGALTALLVVYVFFVAPATVTVFPEADAGPRVEAMIMKARSVENVEISYWQSYWVHSFIPVRVCRQYELAQRVDRVEFITRDLASTQFTLGAHLYMSVVPFWRPCPWQ
jgi:hypothetical protein